MNEWMLKGPVCLIRKYLIKDYLQLNSAIKWSKFELQHAFAYTLPPKFANKLRWPSHIKKDVVHYKRTECSISRRDVKRKMQWDQPKT